MDLQVLNHPGPAQKNQTQGLQMVDTEIFVESPCIDNCCLDENDICLGCFRSLDEIKQWHSIGNRERFIILRNCSRRRQEKSRRRKD
jgi:predicted Fe-S protein YdhL (DUF1289 family)